ncbi:MAG: acyl-CoA dehydrogenase [Gammaproteobacteria bacterium]|nr:acyl-CoA dehydrogenase [Gammaproteobacteria bacterium]
MDFSYSEVQQMLQSQVQKFVRERYDFETRNALVASEKGYSEEFWKLFAELGWLAVPFTEEEGGLGGSAIDLMVMMEEFGKANLVEPYTANAVLAGTAVAQLAEGPGKQDLVNSIMAGERQLALAYLEPQSRYNPFNVETLAVAEGDIVKINGSKTGVLGGAVADQFIVIARESGETRDRNGLSAFLVDAEAEGVIRRNYPTVDGKRAAELEFANLRIATNARLGIAGEAATGLQLAVDKATVSACAEAVGALEVLLQKTVEYTKTRKQFGTAIATFQALQHRMADMFIECQLARSIVIMAAMALDSQEGEKEKTRAVSAAKSRLGKAIKVIGQEAIQIHGGIGMTNELDVGHLFKRVTALDLQFGDGEYHTERYASL